MLRFGVAGLGRAGSGFLSALARHPDVRVTAAADRHKMHVDRFRSEFEGETFEDVEGLCQSRDVDVIYIATPHEMHADHVAMAAAHGKHVIVEKPMALTIEECDRMIAAVERAGVTMVVGHTASFNPIVQKMRDLVITGEVGPLAMISATAYTDFLYRPRRSEELVTELGGGIIYNQIPHQIDAARYIAGGLARSVRAASWVLDPSRPTEGASMAFLEFENGAAASLLYSGYDHFESSELAGAPARDPERYGAARRALASVRSQEEETALRINTGYGGEQPVARVRRPESLLQGELGSFIVTCAGADLRLTAGGLAVYSKDGYRLVEPAPSRGTPGRGAVIDELYYAVTEDRPVVHSGRWAKATMEVCIAMLDSASEHREISLKHQVPTVDVSTTARALESGPNN
jgi:phthalate 4,5-cis-dihydrodiol dehydrogenase